MKEMTKDEREALLASPSYKPVRLLTHLAKSLCTVNDADLAIRLGLTSPQVCNIRHRKYPLTPHSIVAILDNSDLSLKELRKLAGLPKGKA